MLDVVDKYAQPEVVDFWRTLSRQGLQACEIALIEKYAPPSGDVLDTGCGAGRAALAFAKRGYRLTGLELSPHMLAAAQTLGREAENTVAWVRGDGRRLPFENDSFDVVLGLFAIIQHIPETEGRVRYLSECARVLRSNGVLLLGLDNVAPALLCYGFWAWRRLRRAAPFARFSVSHRPRLTASQSAPLAKVATYADETLWAPRTPGIRESLKWHARGLLRSMKWRTWGGVVDALRSVGLARGAVGHRRVEQVSMPPTPGAIPYHVYSRNEITAEAKQAGLRLQAHHSGTELADGTPEPDWARVRAKQVLYVFAR
ncbi:MAG: class I SAM-dependent methyltransferase [Anaerolineae bacterium]